MKLTIGENIRKFRKRNDLTQEALADRLGVTYQSVSRWENGATYPDLELLPAIAEMLSVTVDELLGMPQMEKERRAAATLDELRRECLREDYDAERIVALLRDVRRNYLDSEAALRPWVEGNDRAFRDPKILPEVRLLAEAYLVRHPMNPHVIETMAEVEDEAHLGAFLEAYTTAFDCSARALLFKRYYRRGDGERFESERRYQLYRAFDTLLCSSRYLLRWGEDEAKEAEADGFMETVLSLIRRDATDDAPDMWVADRLELGIKAATRALRSGKTEEALARLGAAVTLLEATMATVGEVPLPTSCRFLAGMPWSAREAWASRESNPDSPEERMISISCTMHGDHGFHSIFPSRYLDTLQSALFSPLTARPEFISLLERVRALVVIKPREN